MVIGVDNMLVIIYNYHIKVVQSGIVEELIPMLCAGNATRIKERREKHVLWRIQAYDRCKGSFVYSC